MSKRYSMITFVSKDGSSSFTGSAGGFSRVEVLIKISRLINQGATSIRVEEVR